jgi:uncharacterized membrane protein
VHKGRLEAFSDGVIAIIITIMVLELHTPEGVTIIALHDKLPVLLCYVLSFVFIGIYWSNHHHLFQAVDRVNGAILWANLHLLFWLSLVPFVTAWMGTAGFAQVPVAAYGTVLIGSGIAYYMLARVLIAAHGSESTIAAALGADFKGRISLVIYAVAIALAFFFPVVSCGLYVLVALMWLVPDRRIEDELKQAKS